MKSSLTYLLCEALGRSYRTLGGGNARCAYALTLLALFFLPFGFCHAMTPSVTETEAVQLTGTYNIVFTNSSREVLGSLPFTASRVRKSPTVSSTLFTVNAKDDQLQKMLGSNGGNTIYYYIETSGGATYSMWQGSYTDNYELGKSDNKNATTKTYNNNVREENYEGIQSGKSYPFHLTLGSGVSYTWMLNTKSTKGIDLTIDVNIKGLPDNAEKSFYIICNAANAESGSTIQPWLDANRIKLKRYVYLKDNKTANGTPFGVTSMATWDDKTMDSVIYRVTVPRPTKGWGDFFILIDDSSHVYKTPQSSWYANDTKVWDELIRPQVQDYGSDKSGMDGQALEGGLFKGNNATNKSQSLNPLLTDEQKENATSYTFSMNITTSTYRIIFNDEKFYIMGPAVCAEANDEQAWNTEYTNNAKQLTWVADEQCYKYLDDKGTEEPIHLNTGADFRFTYGKNFTNTWFGEDGVVPCDLSTADKEYKDNSGGTTYDSQYMNYVNTYKSASNAINDAKHNITFNLPGTKNYYVRFYIKKIGATVNYFYTVTRKIGFTASSAANQIGDNHSYRVFCEWHAYQLPSGVSAYYVGQASSSDKTATLVPLNSTYVPARTPVILASTATTSGGNTMDINVDNPQLELADATGSTSATNLLQPVYSGKTVMPTETVNGVTYDNYLLSEETVDGKLTLAFYRPVSSGVKLGRNTCYLRLPHSQAQSAKRFSLVLGGNATTGITKVESGDEPQQWYTLQGERIDRPTSKGIYIHNHRKVVVR